MKEPSDLPVRSFLKQSEQGFNDETFYARNSRLGRSVFGNLYAARRFCCRTLLTLRHENLPDDEYGRGHEKGWGQLLSQFAEAIQ